MDRYDAYNLPFLHTVLLHLFLLIFSKVFLFTDLTSLLVFCFQLLPESRPQQFTPPQTSHPNSRFSHTEVFPARLVQSFSDRKTFGSKLQQWVRNAFESRRIVPD